MRISVYRENVIRGLAAEYGMFCWYCCRNVRLRIDPQEYHADDATLDHVGYGPWTDDRPIEARDVSSPESTVSFIEKPKPFRQESLL